LGVSQSSDGEVESLSPLESCVVAFDGVLHSGGAACSSRDKTRAELTEANAVAALVEGYHRWGPDCILHLHGDFSFILWDIDRRRLVAASDPSGKHCLAYFFDGRALGIASRALSLLRHPRISQRFDPLYFAHILGNFWSMPAGITAFRQIRRIRPFHTLVLEDDRLVERRVKRLSWNSEAKKERINYSERFWELMRSATQARFAGPSETCLALSGGMDSSIVGTALAGRVPEFEAFSLITSRAAGVQDARAIDAFCKQHPGVRWHAVPIDQDPVWQSAHPAVPISDDPIVDGDALRRARLRLARTMREHGFTAALDGAGGDELFSMGRTINDLVRGCHWSTLARTLALSHRRRALIWRGVIVPRLPDWGRSIWRWRERRRLESLFPWLRDAFWTSPTALEAREQAEAWAVMGSSEQALAQILEDPVNVGSRSEQKLVARQAGVELLSPMLDDFMIELAASLPANLNWDGDRNKPFLRNVARDLLPTAIADREKDYVLYQFLQDEALRSQSDWPEVRTLLEGTSVLSEHVDVGSVTECVRQFQSGVTLPRVVVDASYSLIAIGRWVRDVGQAYGITG
jgi:asparagine synthase (glutamine-hydrolysing)